MITSVTMFEFVWLILVLHYDVNQQFLEEKVIIQ